MKFFPILLLAAVVALSSCGDARKLAYLQGPLDANAYSKVSFKQPVILPGDILEITVLHQFFSNHALLINLLFRKLKWLIFL